MFVLFSACFCRIYCWRKTSWQVLMSRFITHDCHSATLWHTGVWLQRDSVLKSTSNAPYCHNNFNVLFTSPFEIWTHQCTFADFECELRRDTAGQERFKTITTAYYRGAMVSAGHLQNESLLLFVFALYLWLTPWILPLLCLFCMSGHHPGLWHHRREVIRKHSELDEEHQRSEVVFIQPGKIIQESYILQSQPS